MESTEAAVLREMQEREAATRDAITREFEMIVREMAARAAYAAYSQMCNGLDANGLRLPRYDDLHVTVRQAWWEALAAGMGVLQAQEAGTLDLTPGARMSVESMQVQAAMPAPPAVTIDPPEMHRAEAVNDPDAPRPTGPQHPEAPTGHPPSGSATTEPHPDVEPPAQRKRSH